MENNLQSLTIGAFARAADVNVETIRFYQRKGLLPEPDKPYGGIRRYGDQDVARVAGLQPGSSGRAAAAGRRHALR